MRTVFLAHRRGLSSRCFVGAPWLQGRCFSLASRDTSLCVGVPLYSLTSTGACTATSPCAGVGDSRVTGRSVVTDWSREVVI